MVIALGVLAVIDLVVGVSNDAVNFLNSAIGSKAIPIKKIMIIASLGVLAGALSSSGMMEVARKGIFIPSQFHFNEIMYIFMAVMITDIILLDVFNSLGMPTSTTVSIVFELLGAAVTISLIKILGNDTETITDIWSYINYNTALKIIFGILLSVFVAFSIGALVQFISRIVYTFNFSKRANYINAIFGGISITAITYFIVIKGLKGTNFYKPLKHIMSESSIEIVSIAFLFWILISYLLIRYFKTNILKLIIGIGTFSLAMAFSGNDLVNFIGVPIAAWNSYQEWSISGVPADEFSMGVLAKKVPSNNFLLIVAGAIMVITLWFSKKARLVIETGVNLSRQGEGHEKFKPNPASRSLVRFGIAVNKIYTNIVPKTLLTQINQRFEKPEFDFNKTDDVKDIPAFDTVRASINLVVAGILISIGTSLKLPLSTTYVTFMVAMGTSLADRAWGRESAVYRIAGVLSVIGGWFLTALVAFAASAIIAYLIYLGKLYVVAMFLTLIAFLLSKNYIKSLKKEKKEKNQKIEKEKESLNNISGVITESSEQIFTIIRRVKKLYAKVIENLAIESLDHLRKNEKSIKKLNDDMDALKSDVFYFVKSLDKNSVNASKFYIETLELLQSIVKSVEYISKISFDHVNNNHKKLKKEQTSNLKYIKDELTCIFDKMLMFFESNDFSKLSEVIKDKEDLLSKVSKSVEDQIKRIRTTETSAKNSSLYFGILLESKDLISTLISLSQQYLNYYTDSKLLEKE